MMTSDLYFTDLVGRKARVTKSDNPNNLKITGTVRDETMKTIKILDSTGYKTVPKKGTVLTVEYMGENVEILCDAIMIKPEERLKQHSRIEKNLKRRN